MKIEKRDGRIQDFDQSKIAGAVQKAAEACKWGTIEASNLGKRIAHSVANKVSSWGTKPVSIETVQDEVEDSLMGKDSSRDVAKAYIKYREKRAEVREGKSKLMSVIGSIVVDEAQGNDSQRENANVDTDAPMGAMLKIGSEASKEFALNTMITPKFAKMHRDGYIHIHDLDFYALTTTCTQISLKKLFKNGFFTGHGQIREPNSIASYMSLACIAIQANQNDQHGGQSIPMLEYDMAPGISKTFRKEFLALGDFAKLFDENNRKRVDEYLQRSISEDESILGEQGKKKIFEILASADREILVRTWDTALANTDSKTYQACEAFIHNLNTMSSRAGAQVPFSSVNYGTGTTPEQRMVMLNMLKALDAGLGNGETQIFPIHVFKVKKSVNLDEGTPNHDLFKLACKVASRRLFPTFVFEDAPFNKVFYKEGDPNTEVATMGCVAGGSHVVVENDDNELDCLTMSELFSKVAAKYGNELRTFGNSEYFDTSGMNLKIRDSKSRKFVQLRKIIKNKDSEDWIGLYLFDNTYLLATSDHPLPVAGKGIIRADQITVNDEVYTASICNDKNVKVPVYKIAHAQGEKHDSYDVETETGYFDVNNIVSHNCRTRVVANVHGQPTTEGRGNLSFTTINLPRLAIESEGNAIVFMDKVKSVADDVIQQLLERFEVQARRKVYNYPFLMGQGVWRDSEKLHENDEVREVIKHGTLTLGFIGLAEAMVALFGKHHGQDKNVASYAYDVVKSLRKVCDDATEKYQLNFSLIATPAEGLSGRFTRMDRKKFGIIQGVTDREFYTNSMHVPVYFPISIWKKIDIEAPYHELCNGGHISYVELDGDVSKNPEAFEAVIKYMADAGIGYGAVNVPVDFDPVCGYTGVIGDTCPRCGRKDGEKVSAERIHELRKKYHR